MQRFPYTQTSYSKLRFVVDLIYLVTYEYLIFSISYIDRLAFGIAFIFLLYSVDGMLRILEWKDWRVSRAWLSLVFSFVFLAIGLVYSGINWEIKDYVFPIIISFTVPLYRLIHHELGYPAFILLGVDVDGVLADQVPTALRRLRKQGMARSLTLNDIRSLNQHIRKGLTLAQFIEAQESKDRTFVEETETVPGSRQSLGELYKQYHIVIASSRPNDARENTEKWLKSQHYMYHEYFNTRQTGKTGIGLDFLIDDNLEYVRQFARQGKTAILFDRTWNRRRDVEVRQLIASGRIKVFKAWKDISKFLRSPSSSYSSPYS
jgi:uncharacterized HAD superfamily protein